MACTEGATESVDSITFSFLTDEEVRKHSFVKITNPRLLDNMDIPINGGLYDPALGPSTDWTNCKTCGQRLTLCAGHCGHIDLTLPIYNPLLFRFLYKVLKKTCLHCLHFNAVRSEVEKCVKQLELIAKGDLVGAKGFDSISPSEVLYPEESDVNHESCSTMHSGSRNHSDEHMKQQEWTSLQYTEAMSVLYNFLKPPYKQDCKNCTNKYPKITKPMFGWLQMKVTEDAGIRANIIKAYKMGGQLDDEMEGTTDVEDITESPENHDKSAKIKKEERDKMVLEFIKQKSDSGQLLPSQVEVILEHLWKNEATLCSFINNIQLHGFGEKKVGPPMFFLRTLLVPPIKFRPPTKGGDAVMEHPHTILLSKVLQCNLSLGDAYQNKEYTKVTKRWLELQQSINVLFDSKTAKGSGQKEASPGICQLLEKKEGLFRQKMMGKRVNYACRSVISPDPYLAVNEIGIPPCFAVKLTYPERVTPWNVAKLRNAVVNGSECHPGATHYVDRFSTSKLPPARKARISISRKLPSSRGAVTQTGKGLDCEYEGKIVHRHLQDGDVVLVNRQPTLHKPSIMAHVVRVLKGEKTLRMHYANCSTYNADFDGDEMNVHFPQDEVSRAEAYNIVNANHQYVRPSNGEPLRGLIQDHIVSSVLLTKRDTFLSQDEFSQLLYSSGVSASGKTSFHVRGGQKVLWLHSEDELQIIPPAIWKPKPLWTGKQVITALLTHITRGHPPITVEKDAKIPYNFFKSKVNEDEEKQSEDEDKRKKSYKENHSNGEVKKRKSDKDTPKFNEPDEEKMFVFRNELVRGVIDKAQFGEYGLVHTVYEILGPNTAGTLLSVFSRLFTAYLQMHGFTCGVDDLLIMKKKDGRRKELLESCEKSGEAVHRNFIGIKDKNIKLEPMEFLLNIEKMVRSDKDSALAYLDRQMGNELNTKTSSGVINKLLSDALLKPSGKNCISLMTTSGAKGSKVNFQQISSFLGQQELEGKRVPRMVSGKTLPCFQPWDWAARSGGYIIDRFLTGLRPQEYYFHCMAGREGLVDTAVKTSRSGYLQRCLIKNLECLKIGYDHTVRDSDGSIVQFYYGEDGVDVHKTSFISKFEELAVNQTMIYERTDSQIVTFNDYISGMPKSLTDEVDKFLDNFSLMGRKSSNLVRREDLYNLTKQKFLLSLAQPGEPVGVLAAQSVGEPSTQMTLNTFHLAGRGEMNVTLGIPRLQEILMTTSIKTPIMTCPLKMGRTMEDAERLADKFKKVTVADIVESMEVSVVPFAIQDSGICRIYKLKMKLYRPAHYPKSVDISVEDWEETLEVMFVSELEDAIENHVKFLEKIGGIAELKEASHSKAQSERDEDISGDRLQTEENDDYVDDSEGGEDLGMDEQKRRRQGIDDVDYDDDSEKESVEGEPTDAEDSFGSESENDQVDDKIEINKDAIFDNEASEVSLLEKHSKLKSNQKGNESEATGAKHSKAKSKKKKARREINKKYKERAFFVEAKKMHFEVHFKFKNDEPHILLAEVAQQVAKKVYIQNPGKIKQCRVTNCKEGQVVYYGKNPKERVDIKPQEKESIPALHTTGVDFITFWKMREHLDSRYLYSNDIHAILNTFGVEAAREAIIREINHVFKSYGISVSIRHLSLIADYMTVSGGYRPMNRFGGIKDSISPFSKMTFETASKYIVEAALHGSTDDLQTPSARICLGLPVKMGTGSFDLIQKLDI